MNNPPFSAALFDLDGTLLDSTFVWRRVDAQFFAERGIPYSPEDYSQAIQGMSFRETAEYTVARFGLSETADEVIAEWTAMTIDAYAREVMLKPGALEYLRALKRAGVKLAVATANRPEVFNACLERTGALPLFDAVCTTSEVGDAGKSRGEVFRLAAERLRVAPEACAVFEDTLEGLRGARAQGMRAIAIEDRGSAHNRETIAALADAVYPDFRAVPRPDNRRRCVIFTAVCEGDLKAAYAPRAGDFVLCADGGWQLARRLGVKPDLVIGDFDSSDAPEGAQIERFPVEKDDTDTLLCLKHALALGFDDFLIVGGFGGRLDHTISNLQTLRYAKKRRARAEMNDGATWATVIEGEALKLPRRPGKLSVFAMDEVCAGVTIRGAKYNLENGTLTNDFPLGHGNSFRDDFAEIAVKTGAALVVTCGE